MGFLRIYHLWILLLTALFGVALTNTAYAQSCTIQNTFPLPLPWTSQFGDCRGDGCARRHTGLDLFYPRNQKVNVPDGCDIITNGDPHNGYVFNNQLGATNNSSGAQVGSDTGGYGYQMFIRCAIDGSPPVTLRYSHLPADPFTEARQIIQGHSGNADADAPHYHFEILIGNRPVDPECVLYGQKEYNKNMHSSGGITPEADECYYCPPEITGSQANLCDASVRTALVNHSALCTRNVTKSVPECGDDCLVDPDRITGTGTDQPYTGESGDPSTHPDHGPYDPVSPRVITPGNLDELYPPLEEEPPIEPPQPPIPGTPGGPANLTPSPTGDTSTAPLTSCASDTWTAMVNQAVMQTRREDLMNKRFITKSNSVLQYSCFADDLTAIVDGTNSIFTGSELWAERDISNPDADDHPIEGNNRDPETIRIYDKETQETTYGIKHEDRYFMHYLSRDLLSESLTTVVDYAYRSYLNGQFTHEQSGAGAGTEPSLCMSMASIWQAAKCQNFDDPTVFYTFEDLMSTDPREFPPTMQCGTP